MKEIEKLRQAKLYIDKLTNGVNPFTGAYISEDEIIRDSRIISCFEYISQVLDENINNINTRKKRNNKAVYITDEQYSKLQINYGECKVSDIANEINRVIEENDTKKLQALWINDWLESINMLYKDVKGRRVPTVDGENIGITAKLRVSRDGEEYFINYYTPQAQTFIFDNLDSVLSLRYNNEDVISDKYNDMEVPMNISVDEFIRQNYEKCIIISIGSCDTMAKKGSYKALMIYKGRTKILSKNGIETNSANRCILYGLIASAEAIKSPADILILTAVSLGFHSPGSKNYSLCSEVISTLNNAGCKISIALCKGKSRELSGIVRRNESL